MTEEDTFKALKKWSKQDLLAAAHKQDRERLYGDGRNDLLKLAGWTASEYMLARYGSEPSIVTAHHD